MKVKRITLFAGHYGSGKTNIALNYARAVKPCVIADLDIVNPYFRTKDSAAALAADPQLGGYHGLVVASMLGVTVSFTVPVALSMILHMAVLCAGLLILKKP